MGIPSAMRELPSAVHEIPGGSTASDSGWSSSGSTVRESLVMPDKNALGRTTANWYGSVVITRYALGTNVRLSELLTAGKLAGKTAAAFRNTANPLRKFLEFESSPGHHIFVIYQNNRTLFEICSRRKPL